MPYSYPCPAGTFAPDTHYTSGDNCIECTAGYYCESAGLDAPTDQCYAGYYCTGGASSPTPIHDMVDDVNNETFTGNDVCPIGYFCPNGTAYPKPCPVGTFSINEEVGDVSGCEPCPAGKWCNVTALGPRVTQVPDCHPG